MRRIYILLIFGGSNVEMRLPEFEMKMKDARTE